MFNNFIIKQIIRKTTEAQVVKAKLKYVTPLPFENKTTPQFPLIHIRPWKLICYPASLLQPRLLLQMIPRKKITQSSMQHYWGQHPLSLRLKTLRKMSVN